MKFIELFLEVFGWIRIMVSPLLIGCGLGIVIYIYLPNTTGFTLGITFAVLGLLAGIFWASRVWKTKGTINFLSRIDSTGASQNKTPQD